MVRGGERGHDAHARRRCLHRDLLRRRVHELGQVGAKAVLLEIFHRSRDRHGELHIGHVHRARKRGGHGRGWQVDDRHFGKHQCHAHDETNVHAPKDRERGRPARSGVIGDLLLVVLAVELPSADAAKRQRKEQDPQPCQIVREFDLCGRRHRPHARQGDGQDGSQEGKQRQDAHDGAGNGGGTEAGSGALGVVLGVALGNALGNALGTGTSGSAHFQWEFGNGSVHRAAFCAAHVCSNTATVACYLLLAT